LLVRLGVFWFVVNVSGVYTVWEWLSPYVRGIITIPIVLTVLLFMIYYIILLSLYI